MNLTPEQYLETWTKILVRAAIVVVVFGFLYLIRDVIVLLFVAIIITASLAPAIFNLEKLKVPRTIAVLGVYLIIIGLFATVISLVVPIFSSQVREFSHDAPRYLNQTLFFVNGVESYLHLGGSEADPDSLSGGQSIGTISSGIFSTTVGVFRAIFSVIVVFFLSLYMSFERRGIDKVLATITPAEYEERVLFFSKKIQDKIGQWMFGQLLLMVTAFSLYFIGLSILGIPYALTLALLGGILEMVPYAGPTMASIPAILLGFLVSPLLGAAVIFLFIGIQQVQNHIIAPQVMRHTVGLNPVAVVLSLLIGAKLAGIAGVLLAVPSAAAVSVFVDEFLGNSRRIQKEMAETRAV